MMKWDLVITINKSAGAGSYRVNGVRDKKSGFVYMFATKPSVWEISARLSTADLARRAKRAQPGVAET